MFKGKVPAVIVVGILIVVFAALVTLWIRFYYNQLDNSTSGSMFLDGKYSVDGGEWKPIDNTAPIRDTFHEIRFRGTFSGEALKYDVINISTNNVWYSLEFVDGSIMAEYTYNSLEQRLEKYFPDVPEDMVEDFVEPGKVFQQNHYPYEIEQPDTPGYKVQQLYYGSWLESIGEKYIEEDGGLLLTVWNPYPSENVSFSDCFRVFYSSKGDQYVIAYTAYDATIAFSEYLRGNMDSLKQKEPVPF